MKWVISVNNMVYPLLSLPSKKGKRIMIKFTKIITIENTKNIEQVSLNLMIFMQKINMLQKNMISRNLIKENVLIVVNLVTLVKTVPRSLVI